MQGRRFGLGMGPNQYSPDFHLSRPVRCAECGALEQKTLLFVQRNSLCEQCYQGQIAGESSSVVLVDVVNRR